MGNPYGRRANLILLHRAAGALRVAAAALAALLCSAAATHAACTGPQPLTLRLRQHPTTENAIALGNWFAEHQQFACAADTFHAALTSDPNSAQLHYLEGLARMNSGQSQSIIASATTSIEQSVQLEPGVLKPHLLLAYLYMQTGRITDAEQQWFAALKIDPRNEQALDALSSALIEQGDYQHAVDVLWDAPRTEKLTINLAKALGRMHYLTTANQVLTEELSKSPDSLALADAITVVLVEQIRYAEAVDIIRKRVEAHPGNLDWEFRLFRIMLVTGDFEGARPHGRRLLAARPRDFEVLSLNGLLARHDGRYAQAREYLEKSIAIDPNFANSRYNLGMTLVQLKDWAAAKENLEKAIALSTPEPAAHYELGLALRGLGEKDRATEEMKTFDRLKTEEEGNLEAMALAGQADAAMKAGNLPEATEKYRKAVETQPKNPSYHYQLSETLHKSGDFPGERAELEEVLKLNPGMAAAHKALGYLLARSGDAEAAIQHFQAAVQYAPAWVDAWINLAGELAVAGHFPQAREAAARALQLDPNNAQAIRLNDRLAHDPRAQQSQN